jgi:hypothetical protein
MRLLFCLIGAVFAQNEAQFENFVVRTALYPPRALQAVDGEESLDAPSSEEAASIEASLEFEYSLEQSSEAPEPAVAVASTPELTVAVPLTREPTTTRVAPTPELVVDITPSDSTIIPVDTEVRAASLEASVEAGVETSVEAGTEASLEEMGALSPETETSEEASQEASRENAPLSVRIASPDTLRAPVSPSDVWGRGPTRCDAVHCPPGYICEDWDNTCLNQDCYSYRCILVNPVPEQIVRLTSFQPKNPVG